MQLLQTYLVISAFDAKQVDQEPLHVERFELGDLLIIVSREDGFTTFCRESEASDLEGGRHYAIGSREFRRCTGET
jgi:hypothetical protein